MRSEFSIKTDQSEFELKRKCFTLSDTGASYYLSCINFKINLREKQMKNFPEPTLRISKVRQQYGHWIKKSFS